jgi:hypothetical protein
LGLKAGLAGSRDILNFTAGDVKEITRKRPERWWNGLAIGAGVGALLGIFPLKCGNPDVCDQWGHPFNIMGWAIGGAAIGAGIDRLISKHDTVFVGPVTSRGPKFQVTPIVARREKGIRLSWSF